MLTKWYLKFTIRNSFIIIKNICFRIFYFYLENIFDDIYSNVFLWNF